MSTIHTIYKSVRVRFWLWIAIAFVLGIVIGFVACLGILIILTARISYAQ